MLQFRLQRCQFRRDQLGSRTGGGGAQTGGKIRNGKVDFVADGADYRYYAGGDLPRQSFGIESPQIFHRAAAAGDDQYIRLIAGAVEKVDSAHD